MRLFAIGNVSPQTNKLDTKTETKIITEVVYKSREHDSRGEILCQQYKSKRECFKFSTQNANKANDIFLDDVNFARL